MRSEGRILYIATMDISLRTGGGLAALAFYEALKTVFPRQVDIILPFECCNNIQTDETFYGAPPRNKIIAFIALLFGSLHRYLSYTRAHLKKYADRYQVCIIYGGVYAGDMIDYIKALGITVIVIHQNYEKKYHVDNKTVISFRGKFPYYVIRNEKKAYLKADLNLFLSKADAVVLEDNYGNSRGKNSVIGIFEYAERHVPVKTSVTVNHTIIITGAMNYYQTESGIKDFYDTYFPLINREFPLIRIILAGRSPGQYIKKIAEKETGVIDLIANPENMETIIDRGTMYCCPTNIGSGIKLRIMDGLRQGLPVLVHKSSARGYDMFFDKPYFCIYDDQASFHRGLAAIINLYKERQIDPLQIQRDYNDYFSFSAGCRRVKESLSLYIMSDC